MKERAVFFLSDQTGITAEALGHSLISQFIGQNFRQMTLPFIDSEDKALEAVQTINAASKKGSLKPIVFSTLVTARTQRDRKRREGTAPRYV